MITNKLTTKQKLFCEKYIETKNATQSAIFAGYSEKTARQMGAENLAKPYIKDYLNKSLNEELDNVIASKEEVLKMFTRIIRREEKEEYFFEGKTYDCKPSLSTVIKAGIELLNRYDIVDKQEVEGIKIIIERDKNP